MNRKLGSSASVRGEIGACVAAVVGGSGEAVGDGITKAQAGLAAQAVSPDDPPEESGPRPRPAEPTPPTDNAEQAQPAVPGGGVEQDECPSPESEKRIMRDKIAVARRRATYRLSCGILGMVAAGGAAGPLMRATGSAWGTAIAIAACVLILMALLVAAIAFLTILVTYEREPEVRKPASVSR